MKFYANPLKPGDVIRTHPERGYWGCAVVLSARDSTADFDPMCHIATTTLIKPRRYAWRNISSFDLEIASLSYDIRVVPSEWHPAPEARLCIGIYSLKSAEKLDMIGHMDPKVLYPPDLTFEIGDGTSGSFPLCGPIPEYLGHEAVIVWRRIHDAVRLDQEIRKSREAFEAYEAQRLAEARRARIARRST